jgi:hypothetical protein
VRLTALRTHLVERQDDKGEEQGDYVGADAGKVLWRKVLHLVYALIDGIIHPDFTHRAVESRACRQKRILGFRVQGRAVESRACRQKRVRPSIRVQR